MTVECNEAALNILCIILLILDALEYKYGGKRRAHASGRPVAHQSGNGE